MADSAKMQPSVDSVSPPTAKFCFASHPRAGAARMPRDANLAPAQRKALLRYLVSLAEAP